MTTTAASARISEIDILRGLVIALMALDHTRDYFILSAELANNPLDPATPWAYLTRWITHICAPVFFLLTGTGAGLARVNRSASALSRYLIVRGLLLIVLELTLIRGFAYQFNFDYQVTLLLVIWALGWSMVFLGLIVFLPVGAIATIGLALIVGHNAFDTVQWNNPLWSILHRPGFVLQGDHTVFVAYPLIPWIGVMAALVVLVQILRTGASPIAARRVAAAFAGGIAGLLPYAWIPIAHATRRHDAFVWGASGAPDELWFYLRGADYAHNRELTAKARVSTRLAGTDVNKQDEEYASVGQKSQSSDRMAAMLAARKAEKEAATGASSSKPEGEKKDLRAPL